jgi:hypothetical protein
MARDVVRIQVDISKAMKKLAKLEKDFNAASPRILSNIGALGKAKIQSIVPRDTNILARNAHFRSAKGENKVTIFVTDPFGAAIEGVSPVRYPGRGVRKFQLVRWMHSTPGANFHGKDPGFMFTTRDYLTRYAPVRTAQEINKIVADINKT